MAGHINEMAGWIWSASLEFDTPVLKHVSETKIILLVVLHIVVILVQTVLQTGSLKL